MSEEQSAYPLNVYAQAVRLSCGTLHSLYFGYDESEYAHRSAAESQSELTRLLIEQVQAGDEALDFLVFGPGLNALASDLAGKASVTLVTPGHSHGLFEIQKQSPEHFLAHGSDVSALPLQPAFDCIIMVGSLFARDQLNLLQQFRSRLRQGGRVYWLSEFVLNGDTVRFEPLSLARHFENLAVRLGFRLRKRTSLAEGVLPSTRSVAQSIIDRMSKIAEETGVSQGQVVAAANTLQQLISRLENAELDVLLFELILDGSPGGLHSDVVYLDIQQFEPEDVSVLFEESFAKPFERAVWDWKYGLGGGRAIAAASGSRILAHYGGAPRKISYFGSPALAMQICDVMVLPGERRQYGRNSLFFKSAATFLEREIGNTVEHLLGFGFPNIKAMRTAVRLGLYEKTDEFVELVFREATLQSGGSGLLIESYEFDNPVHRDEADRLWDQMRDDFSAAVIGVRDADYLGYRYHQHPFDYHCLLLSDAATSRVCAIVALRRQDEDFLVMDIVAGLAELKHAIIGLLEQLPSIESHQALRFRITRGWQSAVAMDGMEVKDLQIDIPCHRWAGGPPAKLLQGKWWLTAGDMDFL